MNNRQKKYDIGIIGAGVVGCAIARELSRYDLKIAVLEKENDAGMGTSSRNSGVLHSGIHYKPGTLRAKLNVEGNSLMRQLCHELGVKIDYTGKLTVASEKKDIKILKTLKSQGEANGVPGLKILNSHEMRQIQGEIRGISALWSPSTGIISPYGLTIALAENAVQNGVLFFLGQKVVSINKQEAVFQLRTGTGDSLECNVLINSAGLYADRICRMLGINEYTIYPCRGEYLILDKRLKGSLKVLVYPAPGSDSAGLGIHLTNTVDGNILIGPSNEYINAPDDYATTTKIMAQLKKEGHELLPGISDRDIIRSFSGLRPKQTSPEEKGFRDFIIESRKDMHGFINLLGIESPGLTCSPAIAHMVKDMVGKILSLKKKADFISERSKKPGTFAELDPEKKAELIAHDPDYGEVICRCEQITRHEILEAIENPLGNRTIDGIKYRSRAMMGRCQGGFCLPKIVEILEKDFAYKPEDYILNRSGAYLFSGKVR